MPVVRVERVLVTGACGSLGSAVTGLLAARGVTVFAADLDAALRARRAGPQNVVPLPVDVTIRASVAAAVRDASGRAGRTGRAGLLRGSLYGRSAGGSARGGAA